MPLYENTEFLSEQLIYTKWKFCPHCGQRLETQFAWIKDKFLTFIHCEIGYKLYAQQTEILDGKKIFTKKHEQPIELITILQEKKYEPQFQS